MAMVQMRHGEPLNDVTPWLKDIDVLRWSARQEGVLFFRNLLDAEKVNALRSQILSVCDKHGWLEKGTSPESGIANPDAMVVESRDPRWMAFYDDVQRIRDFHALALDPAIITVLEALFGEAVLPHSRNICRVVFPDSASHSTPPHQDNLYIGGSEQTWTVWIPCGDIPESLGGLAVGKATHRLGRLEDVKAQGPGGRQVVVDDDVVWVHGDYASGDAIFLHSLTVHQGCDNLSGDRLRLSLDYRYQPRSHPVRSDSLLPHMGWLTWDEVYDGWEEDDPVRRYWEGYELNVFEREA